MSRPRKWKFRQPNWRGNPKTAVAQAGLGSGVSTFGGLRDDKSAEEVRMEEAV